MKNRILTPAYRYKDTILQGHIETNHRLNSRLIHVDWTIGTFDNFAETSQAIQLFGSPILNLTHLYNSYAQQAYRIKPPAFAWLGTRWGSLHLHINQFPSFLRDFKPLWFSTIKQAMQHCGATLIHAEAL